MNHEECIYLTYLETRKRNCSLATPNSKEVFERIFVDKGTKSFNLIGNYGTGKSTFLWACEQVLLKKTNLFGIDNFKQLNGDFKIIKILGKRSRY